VTDSSERTEGVRPPSDVDRLAGDWLDTMLALQPEWHVSLGRPGREGEYADHSPDGHAAFADAARSARRSLDDVTPLDAVDRVTHAELVRTLDLALEEHAAGTWRHDLNVIASPAQGVRDVFDLMPRDGADDWSHVSTRLANLPGALAGYVASLQAGIDAADTPARRQVVEVAEQARRQAADGAFFDELAGEAEAAGLPASLLADVRRGTAQAREAYASLASFLTERLLPAARERDACGRDRYALASRGFLGAEVDLDETYAWGLEELDRMVREQETVAQQVLPGATVAEAVAHLESSPEHRLVGTEALQAWMQETSDRAVEELGRTHFDIPASMRTLECCIAPTQEGGIYYTPPSDDLARPGRMWWSVPEGVTEFDTWRELTTVYHEGVPGHHLQCGYAVWNAAELNAWRRGALWTSGHGEGWALYAERLMADLGYLDEPADRLGMLDGQRMRAARVVLDLGVHLELPRPDGQGRWTAEHAFAFMAEHVNMNAPFVRFEVNRYLGWPGQAPSYKVGQRIWEQVRDAWVAQHGADLKEFHRQALRLGSVGLDTLRSALV
jgi:uncharacterized protein (DUF885 family)